MLCWGPRGFLPPSPRLELGPRVGLGIFKLLIVEEFSGDLHSCKILNFYNLNNFNKIISAISYFQSHPGNHKQGWRAKLRAWRWCHAQH